MRILSSSRSILFEVHASVLGLNTRFCSVASLMHESHRNRTHACSFGSRDGSLHHNLLLPTAFCCFSSLGGDAESSVQLLGPSDVLNK